MRSLQELRHDGTEATVHEPARRRSGWAARPGTGRGPRCRGGRESGCPPPSAWPAAADSSSSGTQATPERTSTRRASAPAHLRTDAPAGRAGTAGRRAPGRSPALLPGSRARPWRSSGAIRVPRPPSARLTKRWPSERRTDGRHQLVAGRILQHVTERTGRQAPLDQERLGVHGHEDDPSVRVAATDQHGRPRFRRASASRCRRRSRRARGAPRRSRGRGRPPPCRPRRSAAAAARAAVPPSPRGRRPAGLWGAWGVLSLSPRILHAGCSAGERRTAGVGSANRAGGGPKNY